MASGPFTAFCKLHVYQLSLALWHDGLHVPLLAVHDCELW